MTFALWRDLRQKGHLHPVLKHPRLTCIAGNRPRASAVGGEHSSKEIFQLVNSYSEHLCELVTTQIFFITKKFLELYIPC
jgi:hypothetical protein